MKIQRDDLYQKFLTILEDGLTDEIDVVAKKLITTVFPIIDFLNNIQDKKCQELLRELFDSQNDAPLERERDEWEKTMTKVAKFLKKVE